MRGDDIVADGHRLYSSNSGRLHSGKIEDCGRGMTKRADDYGLAIRAAVRGLFKNLTDREQFEDNMALVIGRYFRLAWAEGAAECGVEADELTKRETDILVERIDDEIGYLGPFAVWIVEQREKGVKINALWPQRPSLWWGRYGDVRDQAKMMACEDKKLKWQLNPAKENCRDCQKLNGKVKRASQWQAYDIRPKHPDLDCGGWRCGCEFIETDEPMSKGPLPRLSERPPRRVLRLP